MGPSGPRALLVCRTGSRRYLLEVSILITTHGADRCAVPIPRDASATIAEEFAL
jgi:hypothetical protein